MNEKYLKLKVSNAVFNTFSNKKAQKRTFKNDINGFYIILENNNKETIIINYDSFLILNNAKIHGVFINFTTSKNCPSMLKGLCPYGNLCYSLSDEKRLSKVYLKHVLNSLFINEIMNNEQEYKKFITFINSFNLPVRFNNDGDLRDLKDIEFLNRVATDCTRPVGGYTKRTDIINNNVLKDVKFYLQVSGSEYITTTDLKTYFKHKDKCGGYCNYCMKCYNSYDEKITLLHGSLNKIDKEFNTSTNREFLITLFEKIGLNLSNEILTVNKGLLTSLNTVFKEYSINKYGVELEFKNYTDLIDFIQSNKLLKGAE